MDEALKEIRLALLEADVNFKVVKDLIDHIRAKAIGTEVMTSLSPAEMVIKVVRDELVETLGRDTAKFKFASQPPTVVLMAGLQGSGKTTTSGKLAGWFKKGGHRPMLVSVDVYRPAAREQLKVVAKAIGAHLYEGSERGEQYRERGPAGQGSAARCDHQWLRRADRRHRRTAAHRRAADGRDAVAEVAADSAGSALRGRRHDRPGRGELGQGVPRQADPDRRGADQDGRRCARRCGTFHSRRNRPAYQVPGRGRKVRCHRALPSRPRGRPHHGHGRHSFADRKG